MEQVWLERGEGGDIAGRGRDDTSRKDIWASAAQSKLASHTGRASVALPPSPVLHYRQGAKATINREP